MYNGIDPKSKLFEPEVIDQINNSFSEIQSSIDELDVPNKKHHYKVKEILVTSTDNRINITNRSFSVGSELIIDFTFSPKEDISVINFTKFNIAKVNTPNPYNVYGRIVEEGGLKNYRFFWNNFDIDIAGSGDNSDGTVFKKDHHYIIQQRVIA